MKISSYAQHNITNDVVREYIESMVKPINDEMAEFRAANEEKFIPCILKDSEEYLRNLIGIIQPKSILEIGTAYGYSACVFAYAAPEAHVYTVERRDDFTEIALENIKKYGLEDRITLLHGEAVPMMQTLTEPFDFIFIDAAKSHYQEFLDEAIKHTRKGSIIVCDNILMRGMTASDIYDTKDKHRTNMRHMREFLTNLKNDERLDTALLAIGDGFAVSRVL